MVNNDCILRHYKVQAIMRREGIDAMLVSSNVGILYLFGQIFSGVVYVPVQGEVQFFVRRPQTYEPALNLHYIRKVEQVSEIVDLGGVQSLALELDELAYSDVLRLQRLAPKALLTNATAVLREARMVKTPGEIAAVRATAEAHMEVYKEIPRLYRRGMTEQNFQIEIERVMRLRGSTGVFRTFGTAMEIYMGSLLSGVNAAEPSPYDFALGGAGSVALPLGATDNVLQEGTAVMIDMAGNYGVYLSDMSRTYSVGKLSDEAYRLHELSCRMHREVVQVAVPGVSCAELYTRSLALVDTERCTNYFMGLKQQAQFVGHGLGLQINELPVLTARSTDVLRPGMIIAYEPKFVLPDIGAVGIENTYLVTETGIENLTPLDEAIIDLNTFC